MPVLRDMALTSSGTKAVVWTTPLVKITQVGGVRWGGKAGEHANAGGQPAGGVPTPHTQMGRPEYEAPTREYTHKHTHTQTNTQREEPYAGVFRVGTPPAAR